MYIFQGNFSPARFLSARDTELAARYLGQLRARADAYRGQAVPALSYAGYRLFEETGNRTAFEAEYFDRRGRLVTWLLETWLYGRDEDVAHLEDVLWAVCDEYAWALPAHTAGMPTDKRRYAVDLFAAETAHSLAEILSLCGDRLHGAVRERCVQEIFDRVLVPFERERFGWETSRSNWAAVCGGAVGMTALYLVEDGQRLAPIVDRAVRSCRCFLDSCANDGTCLEGLGYWMYAMQYLVAFDDLLGQREGRSLIADREKFTRLAAFPQACCFGNGLTVRFADSTDADFCFGILCRLHGSCGVPIPAAEYYPNLMDNCCRTCGSVRAVAWFRPELIHHDRAQDDAFFPDGQWAILRSGGQTAAVKGGHNDEPHNHNDIGSLMYVADGTVVLDDLGCPEYTRDYFSDKRYENIAASALGHSAPIVNGCAQCAGRAHAADGFAAAPHQAVISFRDAYDDAAQLVSLERRVTLGDALSVTDTFAFSQGGNNVTERLITSLTPRITGARTVVLYDGERAVAHIAFRREGTLTLREAAFQPHEGGAPRPFAMIDFAFAAGDADVCAFTVSRAEAPGEASPVA